MSTAIQRRRGTTAQHASFAGLNGELTVDTDKEVVVVHDGATAGGYPLMRENGSNSALALGSAGTPSLKFTGDTNTGIYSPGADQVAISTGGSGRLFVDASGRVGVNTTPSVYRLDVGGNGIRTRESDNSSALVLGTYDAGGYAYISSDKIGTGSYQPLTFFTNGSERLRITSTGALNFVGAGTAGSTQAVSFNGSAPVNSLVIDSSGRLGVGTSSPTYQLDCTQSIRAGNSGGNWDILIGNRSANWSTGLSFQGSSTNTNWEIGQNRLASNALTFAPSTAGGGATFSTPLVTFTPTAVGIGTSSPGARLSVLSTDNVAATTIADFGANNGTSAIQLGYNRITQVNSTPASAYLQLGVSNKTDAIHIDGSGRVGIGTTSPSSPLVVSNSGANGIEFGPVNGDIFTYNRSTSAYTNTQITCNEFVVRTNGSNERARIDSSGRLLVGTSSASYSSTIVCQGNSGSSSGEGIVRLNRGTAVPTSGQTLGAIIFGQSAGNDGAYILGEADAGWSASNDYPTRLVFSTCGDGASSPTERMRIDRDGNCYIAATAIQTMFNSTSATGVKIDYRGGIEVARNGDTPLFVNRITNDGNLVDFRQDGNQEGTISVSGTTVSYNGAHLSRWSQLPSGAERTEILRGSVLSNIDEMCEWGNEDNEQLNRMKVSDVEGDKNVSGVFQAWDDDDDTYTNDFYCAMTGDFIIRIAEGVIVERGDLLMSAGDGTAKPQDDDIIRSKTIAKVTSTNVSCTYDDGSYCVPCVLMAC